MEAVLDGKLCTINQPTTCELIRVGIDEDLLSGRILRRATHLA